MSDVKRLPERLECMLFRVRFDEEIDELQPVSHTIVYTYFRGTVTQPLFLFSHRVFQL